SNVVKIYIARLDDAPVQRYASMCRPAMMIMTVETRAAAAADRKGVVDRAGFQARQRHQRLESGAWSELSLNGAVQERVIRVRRQTLPIRGKNPHGELVGIVSR